MAARVATRTFLAGSVAFALWLTTDPASATTIVGLSVPGYVAIAGDSLATFSWNPQRPTVDVCKLFSIKHTIFATSGIVRDTSRGYRAELVIANILWREPDISTASEKIAQQMETTLHAFLVRLQTESPSILAAIVKKAQKDGFITGLLLGGVAANRQTTLIALRFKLSDPNILAVTTEKNQCPGDCPQGTGGWWFSPGQAISRYLNNLPQDAPRTPLELAKRLVQVDIDARVPGVGPPVDAAFVDRDVIYWDNYKTGCGGPPEGFTPTPE